MSSAEKNKNFLELLCHSKNKFRKTLIENASNDQIESICEIVLNILNGNIELSEKQIKKLSKKKELLRALVKSGPAKEKKKLIQKGGFLQLLIPSIISGLATIVSSLISKE